MSKTSREIRKAMKGTKPNGYENRKYLSTGVTQLNLGCSGKSSGGIPEGIYVLVVGDSSAGKTVWALTTAAEMSIDPNFDDYDIIFDGPENGAQMNIRKFFGKRLADRLEPPRGTMEKPRYSSTVEEFYYNLDNQFKKDKPFLWILDSMDALTSEEESEHFEEGKKAFEAGKKAKGSFQTSRPKINSARLRVVANKLKKSGSILIILTQTRQNIGFDSQFNPKTRAGGNSLRFYCRLEFWFSIKGTLKKGVHGIQRKIGQIAQVQVKKNHINGWEGKVSFPIYRSVGIDDLGSCIDFLVTEKYWKGTKKRVVAPEFDFKGTREKLIAKIEEDGSERELQILVGKAWKELEKELSVTRKRKYDDV